ncbi:integral membrane sensor signal transduction histidine kinase [Paenibacillus curdlanolyticus YK9]|uniref:histidine kinase n=1 Tax=Paenibacillus curdlanolyticus YK9 TaxID=717606 RepID=E0IF26_9BACL|nr:HAMP domain-containing sensor histidine kinase [Paenibacillus curdlanolyticus]EFM08802.1 integral membrane sensor signal transduction histidine kinase [Paenibacillus curdlanolyticus YK9]
MRTVRIRTFTLFSLFLILTIPWLFYVAAHFTVTGTLNLEQRSPGERLIVPISAAVAGLVLAFVLVGGAMRRRLLQPLEQMSAAAREIAGGAWEQQLPLSRIKEIAEVRDSFHVMVKGLQASNQKQAELEAERRFVIAAVAHDLRTPLFALRGYLDGIEQGIANSPEKLEKYLAVCKEKSVQLDRLVEDLFTFTKIEYVEAELPCSRVDLQVILQTTIDSLLPLARQKQLSIMTDFAQGDAAVAGDAHLLERAIANLLDNAIRHTPAHGQIRVQCGKDGDNVTFAIRDAGPGFSAEDLQRAFEPLYRGEQSRNRSTGGAGLGLTIARKIVRRHGGELSIANDAAGGACLSGWIAACYGSN